MTYEQLLACLLKLSPEQLGMHVAVKQDYAEYIPVYEFRIISVDGESKIYSNDDSDILDPGHPVLICND